MPVKLLSPEAVQEAAATKFSANRNEWLAGAGEWPLAFSLGSPTQKDMASNAQAIGAWIEKWRGWCSPGAHVLWEERSWPALGKHDLPVRVFFESPEAVAAAAQTSDFWYLVSSRRDHLVALWPQLRGHAVLKTRLEVLASWTHEDFARLVRVLAWLSVNPDSGYFLRQIPVPGLDTKWAGERRGALTDFLLAIKQQDGPADFWAVSGLRRPPTRVRLRVLCPELASRIGGIRDLEAPLEDVARLAIRPTTAIVVENLETGLALPEMRGCVAFIKLGFAVGLLGQVPWLSGVRAVYWGDIDTHGYAILNRARQALPQVVSILMGELTIEKHREFAVQEPKQYAQGVELTALTAEERTVLEALYSDRWGTQLRLEQERLPWDYCTRVLEEVVRD